jgi:hypothetical protein
MTLAELKKITNKLPNPLDAIVFGSGGFGGPYVALASCCEDGILIRTDDKKHPLAYYTLKADNFEVNHISGGIELKVGEDLYEIILLRPLLGKYAQ